MHRVASMRGRCIFADGRRECSRSLPPLRMRKLEPWSKSSVWHRNSISPRCFGLLWQSGSTCHLIYVRLLIVLSEDVVTNESADIELTVLVRHRSLTVQPQRVCKGQASPFSVAAELWFFRFGLAISMLHPCIEQSSRN